MRIAIHCPYCKRPMAASAAFAGQMVACPNCRGEFLFVPPGSTPPAPVSLAQPATPPSLQLQRSDADPPVRKRSDADPPASHPAATAVAPPPVVAPAAPPQPPPQTARLKTAVSPSPTVAVAADGKLPTLQLADSENPGAGTEGNSQGIPLWLAVVAVAASTILSAILLLADLEGTQSSAARAAQARREITQYYGADAARLQPYQLLLREAQQAHSRGDRRLERQKYREVLTLLRAEGRSKYDGLTGTPSGDEELARLISALLAD